MESFIKSADGRAEGSKTDTNVVSTNIGGAAEVHRPRPSTGAGPLNVSSQGTSDDADPPTQFSLQLDTATLVAKGNTRDSLEEWRVLLSRVLKTNDRRVLLPDWQGRRAEFYEYARAELGAPGMVRHRTRARWCAFAALVTTVAYVGLLWIIRREPPTVLLHGTPEWIGYVFLFSTFVLLLFASDAVSKWRKGLSVLQPSKRQARDRVWLSYAVSLAFLLTVIAFILRSTSGVFLLGILASFSLVCGLFPQPIVSYMEVFTAVRKSK
jgi:hypothetical protein